ncbi:MAG: hypothetical protein P8I51_09005 [Polaribacter sp.]|jgi:hypothetical protein|nr:hypothetical protein [Polaribacter sp.]MDG1955013.1 hypothetical protein [Polaribacter sp.]MDG2074555.1 hypothetical protein [Polaribacter sp.]
MLANFFGKSKPVNFIIIIVLFFMYYVLDFIVVQNFEINLDYLFKFLLTFPLFLGLFFLFNFVISKNNLTRDDSYGFLLFVIGLGFLETVVLDYEIVLTYLLLFLFFRRLYSLRTLKIVYQKLFDAGLWLGVLVLISPSYVLYLILLYAAIYLFAKITIRTVLIPIIGLVTPFFLYFTYLFWNDDLATFNQLFDVVLMIDISFYLTSYYAIFLMLFLVFTAVSILLRTGNIMSVSNRFKKSWVLLLLHLVIAIVFIAFVDKKNGIELISFLIPTTIIIANWICTLQKKLIINIVLMVFLLLSFAIHFIV